MKSLEEKAEERRKKLRSYIDEPAEEEITDVKAQQRKNISGLLALVAAIGFCFWLFGGSDDEPPKSPEEVMMEMNADWEEEGQRNSGSFRGEGTFGRLIKPNLKDPDSYQWIKTDLVPRMLSGGSYDSHTYKVHFRAKNSFGGYGAPKVATFKWAKGEYVPILVGIE